MPENSLIKRILNVRMPQQIVELVRIRVEF